MKYSGVHIILVQVGDWTMKRDLSVWMWLANQHQEKKRSKDQEKKNKEFRIMQKMNAGNSWQFPKVNINLVWEQEDN